MKTVLLFFLIIFTTCVSQAQSCKEVLMSFDDKLDSSIVIIGNLLNESAANVTLSGVSEDSLNTLNKYYDLINPNVAEQDISNKHLYYLPFTEDRRLSSLPAKTKDKFLRFIEKKIFPPEQALLVAKYLTGKAGNSNAEIVAQELINLKAEELSLKKIKEQLLKNERETNIRMKLSDQDVTEAKAFIHLSSWLIGWSAPTKLSDLTFLRRNLTFGSFVNDIIIESYELILYESGYLAPLPN